MTASVPSLLVSSTSTSTTAAGLSLLVSSTSTTASVLSLWLSSFASATSSVCAGASTGDSITCSAVVSLDSMLDSLEIGSFSAVVSVLTISALASFSMTESIAASCFCAGVSLAKLLLAIAAASSAEAWANCSEFSLDGVTAIGGSLFSGLGAVVGFPFNASELATKFRLALRELFLRRLPRPAGASVYSLLSTSVLD